MARFSSPRSLHNLDWETNLPSTIKLAYLPNLGRVRLRLSSKGFDKELVEKSMAAVITKIISIIFNGRLNTPMKIFETV